MLCSLGSGTSAHPVIELSRGPFRRRSALYGKNSDAWKIVVGHWYVNSVELQDLKGLPVKTALELVKRYPTLQAMLDRIAELEKELKSTESVLVNRNNRVFELEIELSVANENRQEWLAAVGAISLEISTDRQKYRSPSAAHIRGCIEEIINWAEQERKQAEQDGKPVPWIEPEKVMAWKKRFHNRDRGNEENIQKK